MFLYFFHLFIAIKFTEVNFLLLFWTCNRAASHDRTEFESDWPVRNEERGTLVWPTLSTSNIQDFQKFIFSLLQYSAWASEQILLFRTYCTVFYFISIRRFCWLVFYLVLCLQELLQVKPVLRSFLLFYTIPILFLVPVLHWNYALL